MNDFDSDPDLAHLEARLQRRAGPTASGGLERRVLAQLERAAARERRANVLAVAACAFAMLGLQVRLFTLAPARGAQHVSSALSLRERLELHSSLAGLSFPDHSNSRVQRLAPVLGASSVYNDSRGL